MADTFTERKSLQSESKIAATQITSTVITTGRSNNEHSDFPPLSQIFRYGNPCHSNCSSTRNIR